MATTQGAAGGGDESLFGWVDQTFTQMRRAVVNTYVNSGGTAQKASFSVDVDQIPGLIAKYEEARDKMRRILIKASELEQVGKTGAPGKDEVSQQLAQALGHKASQNPGCLAWAVNDGIDRLQDQIDQLKAAKRDYEASDEAATPRIV